MFQAVRLVAPSAPRWAVATRLAVLAPAVAAVSALAGLRSDHDQALDLPAKAVIASWRSQANPVYAKALPLPRYPYAEQIARVAERYGLPAELLAGIVYVESRFNPRCVSPKGAVGLMQLLPSTARPLARKLGWKRYDLTDPATNLELGAYFLRDRIRHFGGDLHAALGYYNGGRWAIVSRGRYRNRGYIRSVLREYRRFDAGRTATVSVSTLRVRSPGTDLLAARRPAVDSRLN